MGLKRARQPEANCISPMMISPLLLTCDLRLKYADLKLTHTLSQYVFSVFQGYSYMNQISPEAMKAKINKIFNNIKASQLFQLRHNELKELAEK